MVWASENIVIPHRSGSRAYIEVAAIVKTRSLPFPPIPGCDYYSAHSTCPEQSFVPHFYFTVYPDTDTTVNDSVVICLPSGVGAHDTSTLVFTHKKALPYITYLIQGCNFSSFIYITFLLHSDWNVQQYFWVPVLLQQQQEPTLHIYTCNKNIWRLIHSVSLYPYWYQDCTKYTSILHSIKLSRLSMAIWLWYIQNYYGWVHEICNLGKNLQSGTKLYSIACTMTFYCSGMQWKYADLTDTFSQSCSCISLSLLQQQCVF